MADSPPSSAPKRKRDDVLLDEAATHGPGSYAHFSFQLSQPPAEDEGGGSPRSKVAHRFRGLALREGGGGVASEGPPSSSDNPDPEAMDMDDDAATMRKRTKISHIPDLKPTEIPETPEAPRMSAAIDANGGSTADHGDTIHASPTRSSDATKVLKSSPTRVKKTTSFSLSHSSSEPKSRARKRAGSPPLMVSVAARDPNADQPSDDPDEDMIVDPVRAALTWHEDEITVYDSEDSDDDGTGINGIGFKPTPAIAYARTVKRKQQLDEYKKREEREARARRSQRRRGSPVATGVDPKDGARRVRFIDGEPTTALTT